MCMPHIGGMLDRTVLSPDHPPSRGGSEADGPVPGGIESTAFSTALRCSLTPGSGSPY